MDKNLQEKVKKEIEIIINLYKSGDNITVEIDLGKNIAMEAGQRFAIREGGRTIGAGRISEVIS